MSTAAENLSIVQRYADAWLAADVAKILACYHDDVTLYWSGAHSLAGAHRGKAAAMQALAALSQRASRKLLAIVDVMAGPERACLISREQFERDGETHVLERTLIYTIKDGALYECWVRSRPSTRRSFAA